MGKKSVPSTKRKYNYNLTRGRATENLIEKDLIELINDKKIISYEKNQKLDSIGIDFLITIKKNMVIPLQVKSSTYRQKHHRKRYPSIPSIASVDRIKERKRKIMRILIKYQQEIILHINPYSKS